MTKRDEFEAWFVAAPEPACHDPRAAWQAATERAAAIVHANAMRCDDVVTREILLSNADAIRGGERAA